MKALLVPTEQHDLMTSTLETALLLARRFDSYIEGFALRPAIDNFAAMDPVSSMAMATVRQLVLLDIAFPPWAWLLHILNTKMARLGSSCGCCATAG